MVLKLLIIQSILTTLAIIYAGSKLYKKSGIPFDIKMINYFASKRTPYMIKVMKTITRLGNIETMFMIIVPILFFLIRDHDYIPATCIIISAGASVVSSQIFKFAFRRRRPTKNKEINNIGYSFPSGHSTVGVSFYLTIAYIVGANSVFMPFIIAAGLLTGLLIAYSRAYLGVHWTSDVLFGILLGLNTAFWAIYLFSYGYILKIIFK